MQSQRINITLPNDLVRDLKRTVPSGKRSQFIAQAVKEKLPKKDLKKELIKSLKANKEYYRKIAKEIREDFKYADAEVWDKIP